MQYCSAQLYEKQQSSVERERERLRGIFTRCHVVGLFTIIRRPKNECHSLSANIYVKSEAVSVIAASATKASDLQ